MLTIAAATADGCRTGLGFQHGIRRHLISACGVVVRSTCLVASALDLRCPRHSWRGAAAQSTRVVASALDLRRRPLPGPDLGPWSHRTVHAPSRPIRARTVRTVAASCWFPRYALYSSSVKKLVSGSPWILNVHLDRMIFLLLYGPRPQGAPAAM